MKAIRFGYMKFDSDNCPNKKEAVPLYDTASFFALIWVLNNFVVE